jgi:hypothetical protein
MRTQRGVRPHYLLPYYGRASLAFGSCPLNIPRHLVTRSPLLLITGTPGRGDMESDKVGNGQAHVLVYSILLHNSRDKKHIKSCSEIQLLADAAVSPPRLFCLSKGKQA